MRKLIKGYEKPVLENQVVVEDVVVVVEVEELGDCDYDYDELIWEVKRKIGKPTRRSCVRSIAATICREREREIVEESDSVGREFLTIENRTSRS
ncbi:hypothetical protein TSUD_263000 [Trifolium subterraneum]|nr:hypothetical protein TSUD_263000 [Trifolium subterraneum]